MHHRIPGTTIIIPSSQVVTTDTLFSAEIKGLEENTKYLCYFSAFTVKEGPRSNFEITTEEDGKYIHDLILPF